MAAAISDLDFELATHPDFGSSSVILDRRAAFYKLALESLPQLRGPAEQVWPRLIYQPADALMPLLRDPVLRLAIHEALRSAAGKQPLFNVSATELLNELAESMGYDWRSLPERGLTPYRLVAGTSVAIWTTQLPLDGPVARLAKQFEQECLPNRYVGTVSQGEIVAASTKQQEAVDNGVGILYRLVPYMAQSVLRHVSILAWARAYTDQARMESGSARTIPGMVFLSPDEVNTDGRVAEAMLHEATHQKLFDLYLTSDILTADYDALSSAHITVPWNSPHSLQSNSWPLDQALAALHVYVHLVVFALAAMNLPSASVAAPPLLQKSLTRAEFLGRELLVVAVSFGADGQRLIEWLHSITERAKAITERSEQCESAPQPVSEVPQTRFFEASSGGLACRRQAMK